MKVTWFNKKMLPHQTEGGQNAALHPVMGGEPLDSLLIEAFAHIDPREIEKNIQQIRNRNRKKESLPWRYLAAASFVGLCYLSTFSSDGNKHSWRGTGEHPTRIVLSEKPDSPASVGCRELETVAPYEEKTTAGSQSTWTQEMKIFTPPQVLLAPIAAFCPNKEFNPPPYLLQTISDVSFMDNIEWSFPDPADSSSSTFLFPSNIAYGVPDTYTVAIMANNACGTDTTTALHLGVQLAMASALLEKLACLPIAIMGVSANSSASNDLAYHWTVNPSTGVTSATSTLFQQAFTAYDKPLPIARFAINGDEACVGSLINPTNNSLNEEYPQWKFGDVIDIDLDSMTIKPKILFVKSGIYTITLTVGNGCGSAAKEQGFITIWPTPVTGFAFDKISNESNTFDFKGKSFSINADTYLSVFGDVDRYDMPNLRHLYFILDDQGGQTKASWDATLRGGSSFSRKSLQSSITGINKRASANLLNAIQNYRLRMTVLGSPPKLEPAQLLSFIQAITEVKNPSMDPLDILADLTNFKKITEDRPY